MALNEIFRNADHLSFAVHTAVVSGDVVTFGATATALAGVAQTSYDANDGGTATVWFKGAYEFVVGNATYALGDAIYAHAAGGGAPVSGERAPLIDKTATTGVLIGHAIEAKTTTGGTGTLRVRLRG